METESYGDTTQSLGSCKAPEPECYLPDDDDDDGDWSMTEEEYIAYRDQVEKSDGFDVDGCSKSGGIMSASIHGKYKFFDYEWCSQLAVAAYNRLFKEENRELEFVKVLKATASPCAGMLLYITFIAKDVADGYQLKTYQTVAYKMLSQEVSILSFRLKPSDEQDASQNHRKEWFWESHHCNGNDDEIDFLPPIPPPSFVLTDDDSDWDMIEEKYRTLRDQISKSEGFDVDFVHGGNILPMNINVKNEYVDYERYSKLAVSEYNRRFKDKITELEFVEVLKVMAEPACEFKFYITFKAKDLADGGKVNIYQAVLSMGLRCEMSVLSFRLKPTEEEHDDSVNYGKEWFWEGHRCKRKHH